MSKREKEPVLASDIAITIAQITSNLAMFIMLLCVVSIVVLWTVLAFCGDASLKASLSSVVDDVIIVLLCDVGALTIFHGYCRTGLFDEFLDRLDYKQEKRRRRRGHDM